MSRSRSGSRAHSVQVQVQTDGPTLLVLVVDTEDGWRVAGYDRS